MRRNRERHQRLFERRFGVQRFVVERRHEFGRGLRIRHERAVEFRSQLRQ
jgi:hypothetical protein